MSKRKHVPKRPSRAITVYLRDAEAIRVLDSMPRPARNRSHLIELALLDYGRKSEPAKAT